MMALPNETIHLGASKRCSTCKTYAELQIMRSPAGFYLGSMCNCGPYSRESHYYNSKDQLQHDIDNNCVKYRTTEYTPNFLKKH